MIMALNWTSPYAYYASDFHLFPKLKKAFSGTHLQSDDNILHAVEDFLDSQEKGFFKVALRPFTISGKSI